MAIFNTGEREQLVELHNYLRVIEAKMEMTIRNMQKDIDKVHVYAAKLHDLLGD